MRWYVLPACHESVCTTFATRTRPSASPPASPAKVMSERLAHAKVGITLDLYSHVVPGMQEAAAEQIESMLLGWFLAPRL
jgi:hypothetical protein